ncbi:beta-ketoacyl-[acyl-carrier-protein] synthase family protein [Aquihabitans sp. McL0605]|uniref:beta-ketoacyl-[acyl-carrier-protein] synthase family protein n=1 Tax=Aquihabitans sp. McL0605 TaxID=3415671 RepID=UPI003CF72F4A
MVAPAPAPAPYRRVVVTGLGVLSGPCVGHQDFWAALTTDAPGPTHRKLVGFEPRRWLDRRAVQRTDLFSQVAVAAAKLAFEDAGSPVDDPEGVAVIMGTGNGGAGSLIQAYLDFQEHGRAGVNLLTGVMSMSNAGSANIAFQLGSRGTTYSLASGCASGTHAVGDAFRMVRDGRADVAYCGGAEAAVSGDTPDDDPMASSLLNLRVHTEEPMSRPFDLKRQGFVLSEGAGVLRLETLDAARARGAHIYAEVLGGANTVDGYDLIQPSPRGEGLGRAMRLALREAGADPGEVGHINCHGTGTKHNDQAESDAAVDLFGPDGPALTSTKAVTGHPGAAAGGLEAIALALSIDKALIPQTQWWSTPDPEITADVVVGSAPRPWEPGLGISNSVGLGGQNGTVVMGPAPQ